MTSPLQVFRRLLGARLDRERAQRVASEYRQAFGSGAGDIILDDLALRFRVFEPSRDDREAARREGAREVILFLQRAGDGFDEAIKQQIERQT